MKTIEINKDIAKQLIIDAIAKNPQNYNHFYSLVNDEFFD